MCERVHVCLTRKPQIVHLRCDHRHNGVQSYFDRQPSGRLAPRDMCVRCAAVPLCRYVQLNHG